eukprot:4285387-Amphidinium_carterae.1
MCTNTRIWPTAGLLEIVVPTPAQLLARVPRTKERRLLLSRKRFSKDVQRRCGWTKRSGFAQMFRSWLASRVCAELLAAVRALED